MVINPVRVFEESGVQTEHRKVLPNLYMFAEIAHRFEKDSYELQGFTTRYQWV